MGQKDVRDVHPIPPVFLQSPSLLSKPSILVALEEEKEGKQTCGPLLPKSCSRVKKVLCQWCLLELQAPSQTLLWLNSPSLQKLLFFLHHPT